MAGGHLSLLYTLVSNTWWLFLAWCKFSKEFLLEYDALARHFYKIGELTNDIFFAKIDGDQNTELVTNEYNVDGYPSIYVEK